MYTNVSDKWFLLDIGQAEEKFNTSSVAGLSRKAAARLNAQRARERVRGVDISPLTEVTKTIFGDPSVIILFGLCLICAFSGRGGTFASIMAIILPYLAFIAAINVFITLSQRKAQKALTPFTKVRRDGKLYYVKSTGVVPGDLIYLTTGDFIPADALIVSSENLRVSFEVGGGSVLMSKSAEYPAPAGNLTQAENLPLYRRQNILPAGSYVISGGGYALVGAAGEDTYAALSGDAAASGVGEPGENKTSGKGARSGVKRTAFVLNLAAYGFVLVYTLLSLFFPFSGTRMFDAFLAAAALAALTSNGLVTLSGRAALLSVMLYETCSFGRGIILNKPGAAEKLAGVRTLFVNDRSFVSDGRLHASLTIAGGREYSAESEAGEIPEEYLRNLSMAVFGEPAAAETGFAADMRFAAELGNILGRSGRREEDISRGCNMIGYVRRGAASRFDTVVFSFGGRTYRVCRAFDESLISACAYAAAPGGPVPLTPDLSEKLLARYRNLRKRGSAVITTATVVGSSLVLDGMTAFSINANPEEISGGVRAFADGGIRVIFTSPEADGDVTWYNNPTENRANVFNCDAQTRAVDILKNKNLIYLNNVSTALLSELLREAEKSGGTAAASCGPIYSEAHGRASVGIYCTQFDTGAKVRSDACLPVSGVGDEARRSAKLMRDSDIVVSQPHNRRGGLSLLDKVFGCFSGKRHDAKVYRGYLVNAFATRVALMLLFAFTGEFISAPLVVAAGVLTDALALAVLVCFDNQGRRAKGKSLRVPEGKKGYIQPVVTACTVAVCAFIFSRIPVGPDGAGTGFLFTALISSSAALFFCQVGGIAMSPDSDRFLISLAGCAVILVALVIMTLFRPVADLLGTRISLPGFITAAAAVPLAVVGARRLSAWLIKPDGSPR